MDVTTTKNSQRSRFQKLSLKKNHTKLKEEYKKHDYSSDVVLLDESFDRLRSNFERQKQTNLKIFSPIIINDSSELSADYVQGTPKQSEPSKVGNVSFNCSQSDTSLIEPKASQPSTGGWSPAQGILCATPRDLTVPTTPKDVANESQERCTLKTIEKSQKKLLNELYGEAWKSIPTLFKTGQRKENNLSVVTKKLDFYDDDDENDVSVNKENIRIKLKKTKELYLTGSDAKRKVKTDCGDTEKKSKKKLYTEKIPDTPDPIKYKPIRLKGEINTTTKKIKTQGKSITELVELIKDKYNLDANGHKVTKASSETKLPKKFSSNTENIRLNKDPVKVNKDLKEGESKKDKGFENDKGSDKLPKDRVLKEANFDNSDLNKLTKQIEYVCVTPISKEVEIKRLSFVGSLADNVPNWRCHPEAFQFKDNFKSLKEKLTARLFVEFNEKVFQNGLDTDMLVIWDGKLRSTAGTTTNRLIKASNGAKIRSSSVKLSVKVCDGPQRVRDTLVHELCHSATWVIDGELRAGHGPLWKRWARRALSEYPELGEISRCHDMEIHFKYTYKCSRCGYSIKRHSKSIDVTKKCCGYCRGTFEVIVNRKKKDGVIVSTPARREVNGFAKYVKENYGTMKDGTKTHAQVMKELGVQFAADKLSQNG